MPVHIDEMTTEVAAIDGDLPLSEAQIEKLVTRVIERLAERQSQQRQSREATRLRRQAAPPLRIGE